MRIKLPAVTLILIFLLSGCYGISTESSNQIVRPENNSAPIMGIWKITGHYERAPQPRLIEDTSATWVGAAAGFSANAMELGQVHWDQVSYKVKVVGTSDYFLHKFPDATSRFGIEEKQIIIVTVSAEDKFLYEFIKVSDDRLIACINDEYYNLRKISDRYDGTYVQDGTAGYGAAAPKSVNSGKSLSSGLLLGLRTPGTEDRYGNGSYKYSTYWISSIDNRLRPVLSADDIFLPRKDGFWKLQLLNYSDGSGSGDFLFAAPVSAAAQVITPQEPVGIEAFKMRDSRFVLNGMPESASRTHKTILYVGNDYVCVENSAYSTSGGSDGKVEYQVLRTLPVDNVSNSVGIKISDIAGPNGTEVVAGAIDNVLNSSKAMELKKSEDTHQEENFALFRKTGHWFFKGRLNLAGSGEASFVDFSINLLPPLNMVAYDALQIPWTAIKDSVPLALDAYTSPNKDLAVVITRSEILLYRIENGRLSESPQERLAIADGTTVVMAEWAKGDYVENWEKAFIKNNEVRNARTVQ